MTSGTDLSPAPRPAAPIPPAALVLGAAGVIPFAGLALASVRALGFPPALALLWLETYAAVILSFMGGAQWGLAVAATAAGNTRGLWRRLGISVAPALIGWASFGLPTRPGVALLMTAFALLAAYDLWTVRRGEAPGWYGRLRLGLTTAVLVCLATVALAGRLP